MKQISIATTTILLFCLANLSGNSKETLSQNITVKPLLLVQAQWQLFSFSKGRFSVKLPLEPKVFKDFTDIEGQQLDWRLLRVDDDSYWNPALNEGDSPSVYVVDYTDLADEYIQQTGDALLEEIGSDLLLEFELEELNPQSKSIALNSQPGLEFSGNLDDKTAAMRLYLVESRLYALYAISKDITNIDRFFSSFQLQ
ncbi:MAG: hypothetical protein AB4368_07990 [Xenococcaceae cyanobacterium]